MSENTNQKFDDFMARVADSLKKLSQLDVVTVAGGVKVTGDPRDGSKLDLALEGETLACFSRIDLIQGDITTILPADALEQTSPLHALHFKQVEMARKVVSENVATLKTILEAFREWLPEGQRRPRESATD